MSVGSGALPGTASPSSPLRGGGELASAYLGLLICKRGHYKRSTHKVNGLLCGKTKNDDWHTMPHKLQLKLGLSAQQSPQV